MEAWTYDARAGFGTSTALLLDGAVLVATRQGEVHAVDLSTGDGLGHEDFGDAVEDAPTVHQQLLYVPVAWEGSPLIAHDLRSGQTRWAAEGTPVAGSPLLQGNLVVAAHERGSVVAYEAQTGRQRWRDVPDSAATVRTAPVGAGSSSVLVAGVDGFMRVLDVETGSRQWTRRVAAPIYATPAAYEETFFVPTARGHLYALEAASGRTRWSFQAEGAVVPIRLTKPAVDDSLVVVGGSDGRVRALDTATGAVRWTFDAQEAVAAPPLLTPDHVYVGTMGEMLFAVNRRTGDQVWKQKLEGRVKSLMPAGRGRLVALAEPHTVYLFSAEKAEDSEAVANAR